MNNKIGIIITTFLRDNLLEGCIKSIIDNWSEEYYIIVVDQGNYVENKIKTLEKLTTIPLNEVTIDLSSTNIVLSGPNTPLTYKRLSNAKLEYNHISFDCGLSAGRNYGVNRCKELGIEYCIISADSIYFSNIFKLEDFLVKLKDYDIVALELKNRVKWEGWISLIPEVEFYLDTPINDTNINICRNFFLAKVGALITSPWNNDYKVCEHESFFYEFWKNGFKVGLSFSNFYGTYNKDITEDRRDNNGLKITNDYKKYRARCYTIFRDKVQKDYKLKGYLRCSKAFNLYMRGSR